MPHGSSWTFGGRFRTWLYRVMSREERRAWRAAKRPTEDPATAPTGGSAPVEHGEPPLAGPLGQA